MIGFLSSALKSSRMEQSLKLKSIESQPILACSYISMVILINAMDFLLKTMLHSAYALSSTTEAFNEECAIIILPFKDQVSANSVRRQLHDLGNKIGLALQPVFVSKKLEQDLKSKEAKPSIVNQQCIVYHFKCDLCDADYFSYTAQHLFQCVADHKKFGNWQAFS